MLEPVEVTKPMLMSTIDLVKVINSLLVGQEPLRHNVLMRKAKSYLGESVLHKLCSMPAKNSEVIEYFELTKKQAVALGGTYSYEISSAVYDRMTALEDSLKDSARLVATLQAEKRILAGAFSGLIGQFSHVATLYRFACAEYQADSYMRTHKKADSSVVLRHAINNTKAMEPHQDLEFLEAQRISLELKTSELSGRIVFQPVPEFTLPKA